MLEIVTKKLLSIGNKTALLMFTVATVLVLFASKWTYAAKSSLAEHNLIYMALALGIGVIAILVARLLKKKCIFALCDEIAFRRIVWAATIILIGVRWYITSETWFVTDWDAGIAVQTAFTGVDQWATYSYYPNNLFILGIFKILVNLVKVAKPDYDTAYLLIIQMGGVIVCVSCALVACATKNISGKVEIGYGVFILESVFIILSPQALVPYTDTYGMLAPALCLYLYSVSIPYGAKIAGTISISAIGSAIKPQALIPCIAVLIVEIAQTGIPAIINKRITFRKAISISGLTIAAMIGVYIVENGVKAYVCEKIEIYPELAMSPAHYLMMGWNEERGGGYCHSDVEFSISFDSYKERAAQDLRVFTERINKMGVRGVIKQIARKTLSNYADGSGSWRMEGSFFIEIKGDNDLLKRFYGIGNHDPCCYTYMAQLLWMFILIGLTLQWLDPENALKVCVVNITLLGQSLFLILFECRARYFIQFWPYFIVASVMGWYSLYRKLQRNNGIVVD